jgi:hypothetical protein
MRWGISVREIIPSILVGIVVARVCKTLILVVYMWRIEE